MASPLMGWRTAKQVGGAGGQFRRFRTHRSEWPPAAEDLRERSLSQPAIRGWVVAAAPGLSGGHTVYVAVGNLFAYLCIAVTLILAVVATRAKDRAVYHAQTRRPQI